MAKEDDTFRLPEDAEDNFVPAVFARSADEAEVYCELLNDHEIPAVVGDDDLLAENGHPVQHGMTHGLPVLVPEPMLDEAGAVIASREEAEDLLIVDDDNPAKDYDDEDTHFGLTEVDEDDDDFGGGGELFEDDEKM